MHPDRDRLVLAVGPGVPRTISKDLAQGLSRTQASGVASLSMERSRAVGILERQMTRAGEAITGEAVSGDEIHSIMELVTVKSFDFGGADRETAEAFLATVLDCPDMAGATFSTIAAHCHEAMANNTGFDLKELRRVLAGKGIPLSARPRLSGRRDEPSRIQRAHATTPQGL